MNCNYIYCRAAMDGDADRCGQCGHPVDASRASDPTFVQQAIAELGSLPKGLIDMHQILPLHPKALGGQKLFMDVLGIDWALMQSAPPEATSLVGNAGLADLAEASPERFKNSWYVDPRSEDFVDALDEAARRGARVLKLLPVAGYRLDEPRFHGFFEEVQARSFVLMIHTGFITARHKEEEATANKFFNSGFGDPLQIDEPARRFPRVTFIACHSGGAMFHEQGAQLVTQHDNIYGDLSGFGLFAMQRWLKLGVAVDWRKVFWGNDSLCTAYPTNLRLLKRTLQAHGAEALLDSLVRDNGLRFSERSFA